MLSRPQSKMYSRGVLGAGALAPAAVWAARPTLPPATHRLTSSASKPGASLLPIGLDRFNMASLLACFHAPGLEGGHDGRSRQKRDQRFGRLQISSTRADARGERHVALHGIGKRADELDPLNRQDFADERDHQFRVPA